MAGKKRIGVVLSGCGVMDGSEIHEAVLTLLAIDGNGAEWIAMAPDKPQAAVVNHAGGREASGETRNVLAEAARIARGTIRNVKDVRAADLDAVVLPGGFGAARNLSTFAEKGKDCEVDGEVARLLREMHAAKKPIGAICIAPAILAKVFGADHHPILTIGTDKGTAAQLAAMGAKHVNCAVSEIAVDKANKIVTTPAYMLAQRISEATEGIAKLVREILRLI